MLNMNGRYLVSNIAASRIFYSAVMLLYVASVVSAASIKFEAQSAEEMDELLSVLPGLPMGTTQKGVDFVDFVMQNCSAQAVAKMGLTAPTSDTSYLMYSANAAVSFFGPRINEFRGLAERCMIGFGLTQGH